MLEKMMLLMLIILAIATVEAIKLRRAVIYSGVFSLLSSFVYFLYQAPDVAIAQAIIGSTISVVLILTALKKHRVISIYYVRNNAKEDRKYHLKYNQLVKDLEKFLIQNEFEPQKIEINPAEVTLHEKEDFDLLIVNDQEHINIYSATENYHTAIISEYIEGYQSEELDIHVVCIGEEIDYEG